MVFGGGLWKRVVVVCSGVCCGLEVQAWVDCNAHFEVRFLPHHQAVLL